MCIAEARKLIVAFCISKCQFHIRWNLECGSSLPTRQICICLAKHNAIRFYVNVRLPFVEVRYLRAQISGRLPRFLHTCMYYSSSEDHYQPYLPPCRPNLARCIESCSHRSENRIENMQIGVCISKNLSRLIGEKRSLCQIFAKHVVQCHCDWSITLPIVRDDFVHSTPASQWLAYDTAIEVS